MGVHDVVCMKLLRKSGPGLSLCTTIDVLVIGKDIRAMKDLAPAFHKKTPETEFSPLKINSYNKTHYRSNVKVLARFLAARVRFSSPFANASESGTAP